MNPPSKVVLQLISTHRSERQPVGLLTNMTVRDRPRSHTIPSRTLRQESTAGDGVDVTFGTCAETLRSVACQGEAEGERSHSGSALSASSDIRCIQRKKGDDLEPKNSDALRSSDADGRPRDGSGTAGDRARHVPRPTEKARGASRSPEAAPSGLPQTPASASAASPDPFRERRCGETRGQ